MGYCRLAILVERERDFGDRIGHVMRLPLTRKRGQNPKRATTKRRSKKPVRYGEEDDSEEEQSDEEYVESGEDSDEI